MKVTIIRIVIGAFVTITKGLLKGLKELEVGVIENGQNTEKSPGDLRWGELLSLKFQWKTIN